MPVAHDRYVLRVHVAGPPAEVEQRVRAGLANEGFGILTEIDVRATLRDKLGEDVGDYVILGACAPPLAHRGIQADAALGALLPCNVVVRAHPDGGTEVLAIDAHEMLALTGVNELTDVASEVADRLERVLAALG